MNFYVWCEGSCDNVTTSLEEARRWEKSFLDDGRDDVYIVDIDGNIVDEEYEFTTRLP